MKLSAKLIICFICHMKGLKLHPEHHLSWNDRQYLAFIFVWLTALTNLASLHNVWVLALIVIPQAEPKSMLIDQHAHYSRVCCKMHSTPILFPPSPIPATKVKGEGLPALYCPWFLGLGWVPFCHVQVGQWSQHSMYRLLGISAFSVHRCPTSKLRPRVENISSLLFVALWSDHAKTLPTSTWLDEQYLSVLPKSQNAHLMAFYTTASPPGLNLPLGEPTATTGRKLDFSSFRSTQHCFIQVCFMQNWSNYFCIEIFNTLEFQPGLKTSPWSGAGLS